MTEILVTHSVPESFAEIVSSLISSNSAAPHYAIFLSGGPTAKSCYLELAKVIKDWDNSNLIFAMGDERCVKTSSPDSNFGMVNETLISKINPPKKVVPLDCSEKGASIRDLLDSIGRIDLIHLGLGPDGHTASLFPGSDLEGLASPVAINEDPAGLNPHKRITLTLNAINSSRLAIFTVSGEEKANALKRVFDGDDLPASKVKAEKVLWIVDYEANKLAQLKSTAI